MAMTRHEDWHKKMEMAAASPALCSGCGALVDGGSSGCQSIFDEFLARDFSSPAYFRTHRMMVDIYALQHPDRYCISAKSLAAHLTGLAWFLETDTTRAVGNDHLRQWLNGNPGIEKPKLPEKRGRMTILDLRNAKDPKTYGDLVEQWARATWEAYAPLHPIARQWMATALESPRRRRI